MLTYLFTAALEITGCYYFYKKEYIISILLLIAFAWSLTLQPYTPQKAYIMYGGVYIAASTAFAYFSGITLHPKDIIGIILLFLGVLIMI